MLYDRLVRWLSRPTSKCGTNTASGMPVTLATDIGLAREENQDRVAAMRVNTTASFNRPFAVLALTDGMGGMRNGSECATRTLSAFFNALIRLRHTLPKERLELAAAIANMTVYEYSKGGGGATLSALLVSADQGAFTLNVGDSRVYATVPKGTAEEVIRLTVDDSLEEMVGGSGKELLQFLGMGNGLKPHVQEVPHNAKRIVITSDGIHFVRHESLCDSLLYSHGPTQIADQLVTLARWRGAPDNASLACTSLGELFQSLQKTDETGIEIWDPFSSLHVMWLKPEHADLPVLVEPEKRDGPVVLSTKDISQSNSSSVSSKSKKKVSKPKTGKGIKKSTEPIGTPQLSIEEIHTPIKVVKTNDNDSSC